MFILFTTFTILWYLVALLHYVFSYITDLIYPVVQINSHDLNKFVLNGGFLRYLRKETRKYYKRCIRYAYKHKPAVLKSLYAHLNYFTKYNKFNKTFCAPILVQDTSFMHALGVNLAHAKDGKYFKFYLDSGASIDCISSMELKAMFDIYS